MKVYNVFADDSLELIGVCRDARINVEESWDASVENPWEKVKKYKADLVIHGWTPQVAVASPQVKEFSENDRDLMALIAVLVERLGGAVVVDALEHAEAMKKTIIAQQMTDPFHTQIQVVNT